MTALGDTRIAYQADYVGRLQGRLLRQWRDAPRLQAAAGSIGDAAQQMESFLFAILTGSTLESAAAHRLDQWGDLVGQARGALKDDDYRRFIRARILANRCTGKWDEILRIVEIVTEPVAIRSRDVFPCCIEIVVLRQVLMERLIWSKVRDLLRDIRPAGVSMVVTEVAGPFLGFLAHPWAPVPLGSGIISRAILA